MTPVAVSTMSHQTVWSLFTQLALKRKRKEQVSGFTLAAKQAILTKKCVYTFHLEWKGAVSVSFIVFIVFTDHCYNML